MGRRPTSLSSSATAALRRRRSWWARAMSSTDGSSSSDRLRERLVAITRRAVDERITPLVRARFPQLCGPNEARACTLCHSFLRMPIRGSNHRATQIGARRPANRSLVPHLGTGRYLPDERRAHEVHFDVQSAVTVVVSLSDFGKEHQGGLYISSGGGEQRLLPLARGDALAHASDLMHGVRLHGEEDRRWSWVMW